MNYDEFKNSVVKAVKKVFANQDVEVVIKPAHKVNYKGECLTLVRKHTTTSVSPVVYLNNAYEDYLNQKLWHEVIADILTLLSNAVNNDFLENFEIDFSNPQEKVIVQLINTEQNKELLESLPHRKFLDMSIVYRFIAKMDCNGIGTMLITHDNQSHIGLDEAELFKYGIQNSRKLFPPRTLLMREWVIEGLCRTGMPKTLAENFVESTFPKEEFMHTITNNEEYLASNVLLYNDILDELAEKLESDLYLMPEKDDNAVTVIPTKNMKLEAITSTLNMDDMCPNSVYLYSRGIKGISIIA